MYWNILFTFCDSLSIYPIVLVLKVRLVYSGFVSHQRNISKLD